MLRIDVLVVTDRKRIRTVRTFFFPNSCKTFFFFKLVTVDSVLLES